MSRFLTNAAIKQFDAMVKAEYQAMGFHLKDSIRLRTDVTGESVRFTVSSEGIAQQKASQDDVVPMNVNYTNAEAFMQNWHAAEYSDIFDQAEVNFDEKRELARTIAMAIGRRSDQIIIDANDVAVVPAQNTIIDGGDGFTYAKMLQMNEIMNDNGVGRANRCLVITARQERDLLNELQVTNNEFTRHRYLDMGGLDGQDVLGFTIKVIPFMTEGGLPVAANIRTCFAYEKMALGMGTSIDFRTEINYVPEKTSWLCNGLYKAGAVAVDPKGIVKINCLEA